MQKYQILGRQGEGTFSEVLRAQDKVTKQLVAIKCMKKRFKSFEQVNRLREVICMRRLHSHPNIINLIYVLFDHVSGRLALVLELMEMNLYEFIKTRRQCLPEDCIMSYMYQMLKGIEYIHSRGLLHRDIKPENLLINTEDGSLKIADFGSTRGIHCNQPFTEYISTRWYRAPECLLTSGYYTFKMDIWAAGCIFFELSTLVPLFPGSNELEQIHKIHNVLGTPSEEVLLRLKAKGTHVDIDFPPKEGVGLAKLMPNASPKALDLLKKLLMYDEDERFTAKKALRHPYFRKLREEERRQRDVHVKLNQENSNEASAVFPGTIEQNIAPLVDVEAKMLEPSAYRHAVQRRKSNNDRHLPYIDVISPVHHDTQVPLNMNYEGICSKSTIKRSDSRSGFEKMEKGVSESTRCRSLPRL